jgi:hypothetical protein
LRRVIFLLILFILPFINLNASEISNGYIRLTLNEITGSFSLSYLSDPQSGRYQSLFNSTEPDASFLTVFYNNKTYRLGRSFDFITRIEMHGGNPSLVFESAFLKVIETFTPVRTENSAHANGVKINIIIQNKGESALTGLRMLIDTHLGEGRGRVPFFTNNHLITNETVVNAQTGDKYWVSRGQNVSLMGSILNPQETGGRLPDYVLFSNWKRLNDSPWEIRISQGRSFNVLPYSVMDSAVCYFYEPAMLHTNESFSYTVFLTTEDIMWYDSVWYFPQAQINELRDEHVTLSVSFEEQAEQQSFDTYDNTILILLLDLQNTLNQFIKGEIYLNEYDLLEIERSILRLTTEMPVR